MNLFGSPEEAYRTVLAEVDDIVMLLDPDFRIRYMNHTTIGYSTEQVLGTDSRDYVAEDHREEYEKLVQRVVAERRPAHFELAALGPDGNRHWFRSRLKAIVRDDRVVAVLIVTQDVTEERKRQALYDGALVELSALRRLLPICAWCRRIRNEVGEWEALEAHLGRHEEVSVTHGVCPECARKVEAGDASS